MNLIGSQLVRGRGQRKGAGLELPQEQEDKTEVSWFLMEKAEFDQKKPRKELQEQGLMGDVVLQDFETDAQSQKWNKMTGLLLLSQERMESELERFPEEQVLMRDVVGKDFAKSALI